MGIIYAQQHRLIKQPQRKNYFNKKTSSRQATDRFLNN